MNSLPESRLSARASPSRFPLRLSLPADSPILARCTGPVLSAWKSLVHESVCTAQLQRSTSRLRLNRRLHAQLALLSRTRLRIAARWPSSPSLTIRPAPLHAQLLQQGSRPNGPDRDSRVFLVHIRGRPNATARRSLGDSHNRLGGSESFLLDLVHCICHSPFQPPLQPLLQPTWTQTDTARARLIMHVQGATGRSCEQPIFRAACRSS